MVELYIIRCSQSPKLYVGISRIGAQARFSRHISARRTFSDETRLKMSVAAKRRVRKPHTAEAIANMRKAQRARAGHAPDASEADTSLRRRQRQAEAVSVKRRHLYGYGLPETEVTQEQREDRLKRNAKERDYYKRSK